MADFWPWLILLSTNGQTYAFANLRGLQIRSFPTEACFELKGEMEEEGEDVAPPLDD